MLNFLQRYHLVLLIVLAFMTRYVTITKYDHQTSKALESIKISVPDELLEKLDNLRHDVPRSKYIQRIIEEHLRFMELS